MVVYLGMTPISQLGFEGLSLILKMILMYGEASMMLTSILGCT